MAKLSAEDKAAAATLAAGTAATFIPIVGPAIAPFVASAAGGAATASERNSAKRQRRRSAIERDVKREIVKTGNFVDNKRLRQIVQAIEPGEFSRAGNQSFERLRSDRPPYVQSIFLKTLRRSEAAGLKTVQDNDVGTIYIWANLTNQERQEVRSALAGTSEFLPFTGTSGLFRELTEGPEAKQPFLTEEELAFEASIRRQLNESQAEEKILEGETPTKIKTKGAELALAAGAVAVAGGLV